VHKVVQQRKTRQVDVVSQTCQKQSGPEQQLLCIIAITAIMHHSTLAARYAHPRRQPGLKTKMSGAGVPFCSLTGLDFSRLNILWALLQLVYNQERPACLSCRHPAAQVEAA
jgi:hypothetical protein